MTTDDIMTKLDIIQNWWWQNQIVTLCHFIHLDQRCTTCSPHLAPERVISGPHSKWKCTRNFSWM